MKLDLGAMIGEKMKWSNQVMDLQKKISQPLGLLKHGQTICSQKYFKEHVSKHY